MATKISRKNPGPLLFGFPDPDVDKIFTDPEHCFLIWTKIRKNKNPPKKYFKKRSYQIRASLQQWGI